MTHTTSDARKRRQESVPADEMVRVPAALVEALTRRVRLYDGRPGGPAFIPSIIDSARALVESVTEHE